MYRPGDHRTLLNTMFALLSVVLAPLNAGASSLQFTGDPLPDVDRVMIQIDPHVPADVGTTDFTIEFWMRASAAANTSASDCIEGPDDNWISGNIILDRAIWNHDLDGDYGLALFSLDDTLGTLGFGIYKENAAFGLGICGSINVADGEWHHVAITRSVSTGEISLFVDGQLDVSGIGPSGNISYRDGVPSSPPGYALDVDNYLGIGAEKFDADPASFPSYSGRFDELRLSTVIRYPAPFTPPDMPFVADGDTAALYHFDEGSGTVINDSAPGGLSVGERRVGSTNPERPAWSIDSPFDPIASPPGGGGGGGGGTGGGGGDGGSNGSSSGSSGTATDILSAALLFALVATGRFRGFVRMLRESVG